MTIPPLSDRDLIVMLIAGLASVGLSVADAYVELTDPTRSFVDFAILFSYGWSLYLVGKMKV